MKKYLGTQIFDLIPQTWYEKNWIHMTKMMILLCIIIIIFVSPISASCLNWMGWVVVEWMIYPWILSIHHLNKSSIQNRMASHNMYHHYHHMTARRWQFFAFSFSFPHNRFLMRLHSAWCVWGDWELFTEIFYWLFFSSPINSSYAKTR